MRLKTDRKCVVFGGLLLAAVFLCAPQVQAQRPDTMMPEESTAKAKQILNDLIAAKGAAGYLESTESQCHGRRAQFGHNGETTGFIDFTDYRRYPDKDRTEFIGKGRNTILQALIGVDGLDFARGGLIITLYNGDHGWTMDKSGVSELPATAVTDFQEQMKRNIDNLLRTRLKEDGLSIRYGGVDNVDLKQVDWVEITDKEDRTFRLAVDRSSHLLVRSAVITSDQETRERDEDVTIYSNYQLQDSVWTPMQISKERNGRRSSQYFFDTCKYNPGLADDLFTEASLRKRSKEVGSNKDKYKNSKD